MSRSAGRKVLSVTGVAILPARIRLAARLEDARCSGSKKCAGLEEVRDPVERLVVDQDGAEQRLLRLDVVRRGTKR